MMGLALDHVQIAMPKDGEDEARVFFGKLLGLAEIPKPKNMAGRGGCWFDLGVQQLHCGVEVDFVPARKAHVALATSELDILRVKFAGAGYTIKDGMDIDGRRRFFSADSFGNQIEFMDKVERSG